MCEYCNKTEVTVAKLDSNEESPCEWISEEGPVSCDKSAVFAVSEWYVEDHLCEFTRTQSRESSRKAWLISWTAPASPLNARCVRLNRKSHATAYFLPELIIGKPAENGLASQNISWRTGCCAPSMLPKCSTMLNRSS